MNVYLANLIAIVIASLWSFGMNLKFGWNKLDPIVTKTQIFDNKREDGKSREQYVER
jgi:hypothetical protein